MTAAWATEVAADGLVFPTSLAFDDAGTAYVAEAGLPFGAAPAGGRVWRLGPAGERVLLADGLAPPVNGLTHHRGALFVSVGGHPSAIVRLGLDAGAGGTPVVEGLPGPGNYQTNMAVVGPDERLYFSEGAMTNSGSSASTPTRSGGWPACPTPTTCPGST